MTNYIQKLHFIYIENFLQGWLFIFYCNIMSNTFRNSIFHYYAYRERLCSSLQSIYSSLNIYFISLNLSGLSVVTILILSQSLWFFRQNYCFFFFFFTNNLSSLPIFLVSPTEPLFRNSLPSISIALVSPNSCSKIISYSPDHVLQSHRIVSFFLVFPFWIYFSIRAYALFIYYSSSSH